MIILINWIKRNYPKTDPWVFQKFVKKLWVNEKGKQNIERFLFFVPLHYKSEKIIIIS